LKIVILVVIEFTMLIIKPLAIQGSCVDLRTFQSSMGHKSFLLTFHTKPKSQFLPSVWIHDILGYSDGLELA